MSSECDVVVPVYGQPQWVSLCVDELIRNTPPEALGRIVLVDDASDAATKAALERIALRHPSLHVLSQSIRSGVARTVNRGLEETAAPHVLVLNTDCLLTRDAIPKLVAHCQSGGAGLVSPFSNHSSPLTLEMLEGYSYHQMNALLERALPGERMEACTIVGNALLISRECLNRTGPFDEDYGLGYGEDTDYQFRAERSGFTAVAALDTYVYHQGAASFGVKGGQSDRFFSRWGSEYRALAKRVPPHSARQRIVERLRELDTTPAAGGLMFLLPNIDQRVGGCHVVVDFCNEAARRGMNVQLASLTDRAHMSWREPLFLEPVCFASEEAFVHDERWRPRRMVATAWHTALPAKARAEALGIPCNYLVQGYECYFSGGRIYGAVEDTFRYVDEVFTTSHWLKGMLASHYAGPVEVLQPGYDELLFNTLGRIKNGKPRIAAVLRGTVDKGQPFLLETIHRLTPQQARFELVLLTRDEVDLPAGWAGQCEVHRLPLRRAELAEILKRTDVLADASLHEGFGLTPLEALACGCAVVVSDSGGVREYVRDGENGYIVAEVNRPERFVERIEHLLDHPEVLESLQGRAAGSVERFSQQCRFPAWAAYLEQVRTAPQRTLEARSLLLWSRALDRIRGRAPALGLPYGLEARVRELEEKVRGIERSRIWRALCRAGAIVMRVGAFLNRLRGRR
jgi:glycosyltransferase involved in cell wall biosynthesis/GT2 family glycosyltransferase